MSANPLDRVTFIALIINFAVQHHDSLKVMLRFAVVSKNFRDTVMDYSSDAWRRCCSGNPRLFTPTLFKRLISSQVASPCWVFACLQMTGGHNINAAPACGDASAPSPRSALTEATKVGNFALVKQLMSGLGAGISDTDMLHLLYDAPERLAQLLSMVKFTATRYAKTTSGCFPVNDAIALARFDLADMMLSSPGWQKMTALSENVLGTAVDVVLDRRLVRSVYESTLSALCKRGAFLLCAPECSWPQTDSALGAALRHHDFDMAELLLPHYERFLSLESQKAESKFYEKNFEKPARNQLGSFALTYPHICWIDPSVDRTMSYVRGEFITPLALAEKMNDSQLRAFVLKHGALL